MKKSWKLAITTVAIVVVCVLIDQLLKLWVVRNMQLGEMRPLLGEWFNLHYVQNKGMAFGVSWGDNFGTLAPITTTSIVFIPYSIALWAASSAAT